MSDDDNLREEFTRLRRVDARRTPSIEALSGPPKVRPLRPSLWVVVPLVAAAAALLFVCNDPTQSEPSQASVIPTAPPVDLLPTGSAGPVVPGGAKEPLPLDFLLQTRAASTDLGGSISGAFDSDFLLRAPKDLRGLTP
jgi:hypothetical protein